MTFKKLLCGALAVLLVGTCACGSGTTGSGGASSNASGSAATVNESLTLLYSASDSLNPYKAETLLNRQLASLMYDPLVKMDSAFQPQYILARSVEFNGKECVVTLKSAVFSDGSAVTAEDIVFSLELALSSDLKYKDQLTTVKSYKAESADTIRFTLTKADPYFANLLDFPVIKKGSDELRDENKIILPPIGSGRYIFDRETETLKANPMCVSGVPSVATVNLINSPDDSVRRYNLEVGNVSIYHSELADGVIPPMSGNSAAVDLNNLIYLGLNLNDPVLSQTEMRYALASAVDRTAITEEAYFSYAKPATGLFNASFSDAGSLQNLSKTADLQNVVAILGEIGYNSKDEEGFFVNDKGKTLSFKLVAYKDNDRRLKAAELVKQQLEAAGIKIDLVALDWEGYLNALTTGDFDLYLAETRLLNNMDVTSLVTTGGSLAYGIPAPKTVTPDNTDETDKPDTDAPDNTTDDATDDTADGTDDTTPDDQDNGNGTTARQLVSSVPLLDSAVAGFYNEQLSLVDIINAFNAELPIIPLCHRCGITVCSPSVKADQMSSVSDAYFGIANIK